MKYCLIRNTYRCKSVFYILKDMILVSGGIEKTQLLRFGYLTELFRRTIMNLRSRTAVSEREFILD